VYSELNPAGLNYNPIKHLEEFKAWLGAEEHSPAQPIMSKIDDMIRASSPAV
jgi:hypothetical protein